MATNNLYQNPGFQQWAFQTLPISNLAQIYQSQNPTVQAIMQYQKPDYDYGGYYQYGRALNPPVTKKDGTHFTDLYKLPNHYSFSNESGYAVGPQAQYAGHWNGDQYYPSVSGLLSGKLPRNEGSFLDGT